MRLLPVLTLILYATACHTSGRGADTDPNRAQVTNRIRIALTESKEGPTLCYINLQYMGTLVGASDPAELDEVPIDEDATEDEPLEEFDGEVVNAVPRARAFLTRLVAAVGQTDVVADILVAPGIPNEHVHRMIDLCRQAGIDRIATPGTSSAGASVAAHRTAETHNMHDSDPPRRFRINLDGHHADCVGRTRDGTQFFVTTPFVGRSSADALDGCEYVAVFLWNADGSFREIRVDNLGPRLKLDEQEAQRVYRKRVAELGEIQLGDIDVAPFQVERLGVTFGFIPNPPHPDDGEDASWSIILHPGDYMSFSPPWDGTYDT